MEVVDDDLRTLVADMFETMDAAPGVGLAGPQVGVGLRLFVYSWVDDDGEPWRGVAINPTVWQSPLGIEPLDDDEESEGCLSIPGERFPLRRAESVLLRATDLDEDEESEGCLSIPGERFPLRRAEGVLLRAVDEHGEPFEVEAHGWLARIFQHEYDHLDGYLYADRLGHPYGKQVAKAIRKSSWGGPGRSWLPGRDHPEG